MESIMVMLRFQLLEGLSRMKFSTSSLMRMIQMVTRKLKLLSNGKRNRLIVMVIGVLSALIMN